MRIALLAALLFPISTFSQSATITNNVFFRTMLVRNENLNPPDMGTIFSIVVDNREYWITAKHLLTGKTSLPMGEFKSHSVKLSILSPVPPPSGELLVSTKGDAKLTDGVTAIQIPVDLSSRSPRQCVLRLIINGAPESSYVVELR